MASSYLTRTPGSAGSTTTGTFSFWVKRGVLTSDMYLWTSYANGTNWSAIGINNVDLVYFYAESGGSAVANLKTNRLFKDASAWYNIIIAVDSTNGTADDRIKIYVNGVQQTSFAARTNPGSSADLGISETVAMEIGRYGGGSAYFDGAMANVEFVDGTALTPAYFGSTDSNTGIWTPSGATAISDYGTNGFKLVMDTTSPGADTSGKGNTFTVGAGTPTLTQGSPSNIYASLNSSFNLSDNVLSNGNTTVTNSNANWKYVPATIGVSKGKWYAEYKNVIGSGYLMNGVADMRYATSQDQNSYTHVGAGTGGVGIYDNGEKYIQGSNTTYAASYGSNSVLGVALDMDNGKVYFSKDGAWATGSGAWGSSTFDAAVGAITLPTTGTYTFALSQRSGAANQCNFGEGFFATTAAGTNADAAGLGLFAYPVPSGYYSLNTKNLEAYG